MDSTVTVSTAHWLIAALDMSSVLSDFTGEADQSHRTQEGFTAALPIPWLL